MPSKTQTSKKTTDKKKKKQSIPAAGDGPPTTKPNVLARFAKKSKPKAKSVAKKDRPKLDLPKDVQEAFLNYAPLKRITDLFETRRKQEAAELADEILEHYIELLWAKKKRPDTPVIEARGEDGKVDSTGQFLVQQGSFLKVNMPEVGDDEEGDKIFVQALVDLGLQKDDAENLTEKELDLTPQWAIPLTTLIRGSGETASAASKLFCWLQGEDEEGNEIDPDEPLVLSAAERQSLGEYVDENATYNPQILEPSNFLDRVCDYANTVEQVKAILTMIRPRFYVTRTKFGVNSSETEKRDRLRDQAAVIVGEEIDKED